MHELSKRKKKQKNLNHPKYFYSKLDRLFPIKNYLLLLLETNLKLFFILQINVKYILK